MHECTWPESQIPRRQRDHAARPYAALTARSFRILSNAAAAPKAVPPRLRDALSARMREEGCNALCRRSDLRHNVEVEIGDVHS